MDVAVTIKGKALSRDDLLALLQAVRDCEQARFREKLIGIGIATEPKMPQDEVTALLGAIQPPFTVTAVPQPESESRTLNLGPRLVTAGGDVVGTCDGLSLAVAGASDKELHDLQSARVIGLVRAGGET